MIASIVLLLIGAQDAEAHQAPPIIVEGQKPAEDRKVCRTQREIGSRVVKTICRSAVEQRQVDVQARNAIRLGKQTPNGADIFPPPPSD